LGIVLFTLGFLFTSLKENEPRAAMMAGALSVFLIGMELAIYFFYTLGFFFHFAGMLVLVGAWVATGAAIYFLCRRAGPNQRALKGIDGYVVGRAQRFDEREQVFARERSLRPDSAEYKEFYRLHPELESMDSERRKAGGLLGVPNLNLWIRKEEKQAACWGSLAPSIDRAGHPMFRQWRRRFRFHPISENLKATARRRMQPELIVHL
jgi:hypothetical protein